jgi:hypothetical protein
MPGLVPGIHVFMVGASKDVDGRAIFEMRFALCPAMTRD